MAPRGPRPVLILLLVLLAAGLAQLSEGASYRQFLTRHVDFPRTRAPTNQIYCNTLMQRRGLTRPVCKPTNTFVHAPPAQLQAVCHGGGKRLRKNLHNSITHFHLTACQLTSVSPLGRCVYQATLRIHRIRVACAQGLPVQLVRVL
ncbi:ribonuclease-like [Emydura macquarii macquarii]|uniref:ribonuclease-like n=1 Tax=Emydura macquarii macquarii TaxID=1129001 RepID=UPI00352A4413